MIGSPSIPFNPQMSLGGPAIAQLLAKLGAPANAMPNVMAPGGGVGGGQTSGGGLSAGLPMPIGGPSTGPMAPIAPGTEPMPMGNQSPMASQLAPPPGLINDTPLPGPGPIADVDPAMGPAPLHRNFFGKVGDYLHQPGVAAALFRSGAATMQGGLGAGLEAGANYMDHRKADETKAAQQAFDNAIATGRLDLDKLTNQQRTDLARAGIQVDVARLDETRRSNQAGEKIAVRGQDVSVLNNNTNNQTARRGQDVSVVNNNTDNSTAQRGQDLGYSSNIYGTNAQILTAGIGSRGNTGYTETETVNPGTAPGWFSAGTPASKTTTRTPIIPGLAPAASAVSPPFLQQPPAAAPLAPPKPGDVVHGKTFLGGDPRNPKSWR